MEINLHNTCEDLRQRLASREDYSDEAVFNALDSAKVGFLDIKNFDNFMKRMKRKIDEDQAVALLRRIELDQDSTHRIKKSEFMDFIKPQEPFSKMLRRIQMKKEEDFGKLAQKKLVDKHTVNTKKLPDKVKSAHSENQTNKFNQN
jgi:hypothetical protein